MISFDDEEFEGLVEDIHASTPLSHEDEKMVISVILMVL